MYLQKIISQKVKLKKKIFFGALKSQWWKEQDQEPDLYPLVRGTDPQILIRTVSKCHGSETLKRKMIRVVNLSLRKKPTVGMCVCRVTCVLLCEYVYTLPLLRRKTSEIFVITVSQNGTLERKYYFCLGESWTFFCRLPEWGGVSGIMGGTQPSRTNPSLIRYSWGQAQNLQVVPN
jgi:hypothetical protein